MASFVPFRNGQGSDRPSFDVSDVLQEVAERLEIYAMRRGVEVEVDSPPYAMVSADPAPMRQVFSQLMTLAIDATSPGGEVIVTAFHEEEGVEVEVAAGGAEMIDAPSAAASSPIETAAAAKRLADARRLLAAEGVELEIRDCADGAKAYIMQFGRPGTQDAESLRAA
jgi:signal transduction histidine kinase